MNNESVPGDLDIDISDVMMTLLEGIQGEYNSLRLSSIACLTTNTLVGMASI